MNRSRRIHQAAAGLALCAGCSEAPPNSSTAQGVETASAEKPAADLAGDVRPLFWETEQRAVAAPECDAEDGCRMTLPLVVPSEVIHNAGLPVRFLPSKRVLFAGCGLVGARYTERSASYDRGVSREFWYDVTSGTLVGTALRSTDQKVSAWGSGPPKGCSLTLCDPSTIVQRDPWIPPEHGEFDFRRYCDMEDVGLDPSLQGDWQRHDARTAAARDFRLEPTNRAEADGGEVQP